MIFFVTVLRALAAMIITNAHYVGVYPTDLIANGGLLGDVIFFAVSGFCLANPKLGFFRWYGKRISRIYPQVWLVTLLYALIGIFSFAESGVFGLLVYPTNYHFVASIMVLYIPFYFVSKYLLKRETDGRRWLWILFAVVLAAQLAVYIFAVDKTVYTVDTVRKPFIRFLFAVAMLIGVYFRMYLPKYRNKNRVINWIVLVCLLPVYFVSKIAFSKYAAFSNFQILNQYILLLLLWFVFRCFAGIDGRLEHLPQWVKKIIGFISEITLEIYIVQIGIIPFFAKLVPFPLNWIVLTSVIVGGAFLLHFVTKQLVNGSVYLIQKVRKQIR